MSIEWSWRSCGPPMQRTIEAGLLDAIDFAAGKTSAIAEANAALNVSRLVIIVVSHASRLNGNQATAKPTSFIPLIVSSFTTGHRSPNVLTPSPSLNTRLQHPVSIPLRSNSHQRPRRCSANAHSCVSYVMRPVLSETPSRPDTYPRSLPWPSRCASSLTQQGHSWCCSPLPCGL
jgi:hypothetical protein